MQERVWNKNEWRNVKKRLKIWFKHRACRRKTGERLGNHMVGFLLLWPRMPKYVASPEC